MDDYGFGSGVEDLPVRELVVEVESQCVGVIVEADARAERRVGR